MGGQMWGLYEAHALALGEHAEFQRVRALLEGLLTAVGSDAEADAVKKRAEDLLTRSNPREGLLTRQELMSRWQVSKHIIKRHEQMGMPVAMRVGGRPRYNWEEVEKWREEALRKGKGSEAGTGDCGPGMRRVESGRLVSPGRRRTGTRKPAGRRPRLDLLDSYGNSTKVQRQTL